MKLLVAIDLSPTSQRVLALARELAAPLHAEVWLLHVAQPEPDFVGYDPGPQSERDFVATGFRQEHRELQRIAEEWRAIGLSCTSLQIQGPTIEKILAEARRLAVDMIIVGYDAKGPLQRILFGSTTEGVLHRSGIPVLVVPPRH